jgi:ATP-dependent Clp protease ATP-binding subunit ClpA
MFERFTDRARQTVVLAQEEARRLNHNYIGTEHVLLGLIHEREGVAARALMSMGVSLEAVRREIKEIIGTGDHAPTGHIPFTPRAKKVLELSLREALQLGHNYIGTEHILLGLVREGEGVAAQVLVKLGADLDRIRKQVIILLSQGPGVEVTGSASQRRTPAAEQVVAAAQQLAGGSPVGSHHLLEALIRSEDSAAAKVLTSVGLDADTLAAKIDEVGIEDTADLTDDEAAARRMEIRLADDEVQLVLRDESTIDLVKAITEQLGGPIRGDDPVVGGLTGLRHDIVRFLAELKSRVAPPEDETESEGGKVSSLIQRAIHSRLRRRSR